ncbi:MAG: hypothetical protein NT030_04305 [Candidatus Saganbacteria bacterium]|nr:hypothetical protein [Candidatus Saganbacteria bacterium]
MIFKTTIILIPLFLAYILLSALFSSWLRVTEKVKTPYTRKVFHFLIFTFAAYIMATLGFWALILFGILTSACVIYAVLRGSGFPFYESMARPTDGAQRSFFVLIPLIMTAFGGIISFGLFGKFAAVGILVSGWGDAVSEPVGIGFGKHKYGAPSLAGVRITRSLEGSAAFALSGILAGFVAMILCGVSPLVAIAAGAVCGIAGAVVEAFSSHGLDNLTVQIVASATAYFMVNYILR